ncbi:MAG: trigger factor [Elusimicrobiota bacterium]|jgi:trigger factor|nr:trigger factor [Elusimicrobiota bacterium]
MEQSENAIAFKHSVVARTSVSINIDVEVTCDAIKNELVPVCTSLQKKAKIPGFRQGKVPLEIIKKNFAESIKDEVVQNILDKTLYEVLKVEKFNHINSPALTKLEYNLNTPFKYSFSAQCHPEVKAMNYKNIPIIKEIFKTTDKNISCQLELIRKRYADFIPSTKGVCNENSVVCVGYEAFDLNGQKLADIKIENHMIDMSAENTLKEFKDILIGTKAGDNRETVISYPVEHPNKCLAGKTVKFKVKVIEVKEVKFPNLDDEFAKDCGVENLNVLKNKIKEDIEEKEKHRQNASVRKQIIEGLLKRNEFEVPQCLVELQEKDMIERVKNDVVPEHVNEYLERNKEHICKDAKDIVKVSYVFNSIKKEEKLNATDSDLQKEKERRKALNPKLEKNIDEYFRKNFENIVHAIEEKKVFDFLVENADIKTVEKELSQKDVLV